MPTPLFNLLEVESKLFSWLHDTHPFVKRGARHAVARGDVLDLRGRIGQQCPDFPYLLVVQLEFAPAHPAPGTDGGKGGQSPLANQVSLKLGQGSKYMELELARGAARVNFLAQAFKGDAALLQITDDLHEV